MMTPHFSRLVLIVLLIVGLGGCASFPEYRPDLPEDVGSDGLVVAQVVGIDNLRGWSRYTDVLVNDKKKGRVVNGFVAFPLSPGDYDLSGLFNESVTGSSSAGAYRVTTVSTTTLPLKRKFTVRPREVTNLGLIILYPDPNDKERKKFLRLFADNTVDMKHFVKTAYRQLATKLNVDNMALAPGDLIPPVLTEALRKDIATREAIQSQGYAHYVAGDVGTVAEVQKDKDGKISGVELIDVPTLSNLQSESPNYVLDRLAFLTTNNRLFVVQNGKATEKRPPNGLRAGKVFAFGKTDLAIIDDRFEIYTSANNGDAWQSHLAYKTEDKTSARLSPGAEGYYIYAATPPVALSYTLGKGDLRPLPLPQELKALGFLREKPVGLFAENQTSVFKETEKRTFFFLPQGKTTWDARMMPAANCEYIKFADMEGKNVSTVCGESAVGGGGPRFQYTSGDGGKTWQRKD
jgi:hypothetical protein